MKVLLKTLTKKKKKKEEREEEEEEMEEEEEEREWKSVQVGDDLVNVEIPHYGGFILSFVGERDKEKDKSEAKGEKGGDEFMRESEENDQIYQMTAQDKRCEKVAWRRLESLLKWLEKERKREKEEEERRKEKEKETEEKKEMERTCVYPGRVKYHYGNPPLV